uniref:Uncharacterized protein n=1 Tax=Strigamia maritima TaxID=126957 RepID=T1J2E6_STRMM
MTTDTTGHWTTGVISRVRAHRTGWVDTRAHGMIVYFHHYAYSDCLLLVNVDGRYIGQQFFKAFKILIPNFVNVVLRLVPETSRVNKSIIY